MSRISKNVAEYFPHFAADSRTKSILESRFGNDGYAFWFKLLELLCKTDGHSYDCRNALDWEYLLGYTRVSAETAGQILDLLAGMGKIDQPLWADGQTIWCQALVENLRPVYEKRRRLPPEKPLLGRESPGRADYFPEKKPGKDFSPQAVPEKRQSRGKKSRGEKSKEESPCSPPAGDGGRFSSDGKGEKAGTQGEEVQEVLRMSGKVGMQDEGAQGAQEVLRTGGKAGTQGEGAQGAQEVLRTGGKAGTQSEGVQEAQEVLRTGGKAGTQSEEVQEAQEVLRMNGKAGTKGEEVQGAQEAFRTGGKAGTKGEEAQESQEILRTGGKDGTKGEEVQESQEVLRTSGKAGTQGEEVQEAQEVLRTGGKAGTQDEGVQGAQEALRTSGKARTQGEEVQEVLRTGGKAGMQGKGVQEAFERFWTAYPRKVGKGRAEKLFVRLKPDHRLLDTMLTAIKQAKGSEQWQRDQGRYIPNPSTWLGQRRWEDEPFPDSPAYCGDLDPPGYAPPRALPPELAREKERREEALRRFRAGECGWEELMPE